MNKKIKYHEPDWNKIIYAYHKVRTEIHDSEMLTRNNNFRLRFEVMDSTFHLAIARNAPKEATKQIHSLENLIQQTNR